MSPLPNKTRPLDDILLKLSRLGVTSEIQQKIGAFGVCWGLFEAHLESVVWLLNGESVSGVHPSTDRTPISEWISKLSAGHPSLSDEANKVLAVASKAAVHLMHYRHSLFHGMLVPFPDGAPMFIRNPRWNGELRKRKSGSASVGDNLLDLAIESAWTLVDVNITVQKIMRSEISMASLERLKTKVNRAKSMSCELHLTASMNHEKY